MMSAADNYHELCRLCASYDDNKLDIFSDSGQQRKLIDKITSCLSFEVSKDDQFPKSLCFRCIYNLENFYDFRRGCIDARAKLVKAIKHSKQLKAQEHRLRDLPEITIEHKIVPIKVKRDPTPPPVNEYEDADPPNPADFLEACLADSPSAQVTIHPVPKQPVEEEEGPFPCKTCGRLFNSKSSLTIHAKFHQEKPREVDGNEPYACYVCEKVFSSKGHLALHSRVHIGETGPPPQTNRPVPAQMKLYRCDLCNKSYSMAKHLWGHVSTAHKGDPLVTCNQCLRTFSSIANLEDHKRVKHREENQGGQNGDQPPKPADEAPLDLTRDSQRPDENQKGNYSPRKVQRESSGSTEGNLEIDIDEPEQKEPLVYNCLLCGLKFDTTQVLSDHLINQHNYYDPIDFESLRRQYGDGDFPENMMEAETVFCCEVCYREFNDRASLWLHMLYSHRDEASKACGICLKVCQDNETLTQHVESVHSREKTERRRYSCQVCARQHDSRKKLVTHARIHKLADPEGNLVDPETIVVLNSEFYGENQQVQNMSDNGFLSSCDICFKVFENETKLNKHKRSTHKDGMNNSASNNYNFFFACELCGLSHLSRPERWKHMATAHNGDPAVTCEVKSCGKVFPTSAVKKEHEATHHQSQGEYPNTCEVCGKMWKTRVEYWKHMMGVHSESLPYICGVCLKVFTDLQSLVNHVRDRHWPLVGGDFCCDVCGRPYSKVSKMSRHRKIHFADDTPPELRELLDDSKVENDQQQQQQHFLQNHTTALTCDLCVGTEPKVEYENLESLGKHRHDTHNVMPCDLCPKYYGRTSHLWKHVNKIHKGHPDITCPVCQRTSASRAHLLTHINKHHKADGEAASTPDENAVHTCEKCSKIFRKGSLMRKHLKHCKGPRPTPLPLPPPVNGVYTCPKCPKTFIAQSVLNKHIRGSHVTFKCEVCEIKFDTKTELFLHISAEHADHPDLKCAQAGCDKLLRCKADLDKHQRDHRSSHQFHICKFCAEILTAKVKLRMHLKAQHSKEVRHLCALCLKALKDFDELRDHIQEQHGALLSRPHTCQVCAKPCSSRSKLMDHTRNHGPEFHPCKICLKIFPTKEELDNHCENHPMSEEEEVEDEEDEIEEVDDLDTSSICDIIGAPQGKVEKLDAESIRDIIGAAQGNVKLNRVSESDKEDEIPTKKMKLGCDKCSKSFSSHGELKEHVLFAHKGLPPKKTFLQSISQSKDRPANFMHQLGLVPDGERGKPREVRRVFEDDNVPSPCELCDKVWPAKRHLWQHLIRFHKAEAGRCCGVCLKLCSSYTNLTIHLAINHSKSFDGEGNNMSCKVCGKYHNGRVKLMNHAMIHFGQEARATDSAHHCMICKAKFGLFPALVDHLRRQHDVATEAKPLEESMEVDVEEKDTESEAKTNKPPFLSCEVCSLVFASEVGLTNHKRTHEHSDCFKCGQCGEVFKSADALKAHSAVKHKGSEFVCAECKSNFNSYEALIKHNKNCQSKKKSPDSESELDEEVDETDNEAVDESMSEIESDDEDSEEDKTSLSEEDEDEIEADLEEVDEDELEEPPKDEKEIRAIEAYVCDNMEDNMVEVVKIDLSDDIDTVKAS